MNKIHLPVIFSFILCSCGLVKSESPVNKPKVPTNIPSQTTDEEEELVGDGIICKDFSSSYYVGEVMQDVFKAKIILRENGEEKDISYKPSLYEIKIKNSSGVEVDPSTAFVQSGEYSYTLVSKTNPNLKSNQKKFQVLSRPAKTLQTTTQLPKGFTYDQFENSIGNNLSFQTTGAVSALVIPVEISDYPFSDSIYGSNYLEKINKVFNGDGQTDTGYWESVRSYYKKSSNNQLKFTFDIAEPYVCGYSSSFLLNFGTSASFNIAQEAITNYKTNHGESSTKKYDFDNDGYIDGVWFIYSAPDYETGAYGTHQGRDLFWAFCTDDLSQNSSEISPNLHSFGWASISFMSKTGNNDELDSHIYIHETGHLLSLPDYYSYDLNGSLSGALGQLDMMDFNIGDHNAFTKISLGWGSPYVPDGDCLITLKPNATTGECILLADSWNGTAFDEYILLELVTPTSVAEQDANNTYPYRSNYYSEPGIRVLHIDARLAEFKYFTFEDGTTKTGVQPVKSDGQRDYYLFDNQVKGLVSSNNLPRMTKDPDIPCNSRNSGYTVVNANSASRCLIDEEPYINNRLISLIGRDNRLMEGSSDPASNASLFKSGESWTINGKTAKFFNGDIGCFNNNDNFSFVFSVLACDSNSASILVKKVNNRA